MAVLSLIKTPVATGRCTLWPSVLRLLDTFKLRSLALEASILAVACLCLCSCSREYVASLARFELIAEDFIFERGGAARPASLRVDNFSLDH